jgi:ElaB/YqjD/DUF883 family membrane-anchored ribosome-binding protein
MTLLSRTAAHRRRVRLRTITFAPAGTHLYHLKNTRLRYAYGKEATNAHEQSRQTRRRHKPASAKSTVSSTASEAVNAATDAASEAYDTAKSKVEETVERGKAIVSEATATASDTADTVSDAASAAYDTVKRKVEETAERGNAMVSEATAAASDAVETASQQIKTFASELETMTRRNPLGTLAGAVIVGVLIGMMTSSRRS